MAQQTINIGTAANDGLGDPLRTAFGKCNDNFGELYSRAQVTPPSTLVGTVGDQAGMYAYDENYFYYCFANYDGSSTIWAQVSQIGNVAVAAIINGSSNVSIGAPDANITMGVNGTANVVVISTGAANIAGNVDITGVVTSNSTITANGTVQGANLATPGFISATGNITGGNMRTAGQVTATGNITGGNINTGAQVVATGNITGGNIVTAGAVDAATVVATDASVTGNLTGANVLITGETSSTGNVVITETLSVVGNVTTDAYFIGTFVGNVTGNFVVPGSNTWVLFNTEGNADASSNFVFDAATNTVTVDGIVSATGNVVGGNVRTAGLVSATGTVTGSSLVTGGTVSATGNVTGGNVRTAGQVSATGNITGGNLSGSGISGTILTASQTNITSIGILTGLSVSGNVTSGNISVPGLVSAVGNITGGNLRTGGIVSAAGNVTGASLFGTLGTAAQIGITSVGTLTSLSVSGNVQGGNLRTAGLVSATGTVTGSTFVGSAAGLTAIPAANVTGTLSINTTGSAATVSDAAQANITSVGTLTSVSVSGNVQAGNLRTAGLVSATGNITGGNVLTGGVVSVTGNIQGGNVRTVGQVSATGNITTAGVITVNAGDAVTAIVNGGSNAVGNIGSSSKYFNTVFATATTALYADLAESYLADADYTAGTVVSFGGEAEVTQSTVDADPAVAGVVSSAPAYAMNSGLQGDHVCVVALTGRVPCRVTGAVKKGSLMVSNGDGTARAETAPAPGTIIGKSLENFEGSTGTIEVVVGRF